MGRRSDKHNSGLRGMRPSDAGEQQENTQQQGNTHESAKDASHDGLPDHYALHLVFLFLMFYGRTGVPPMNGFGASTWDRPEAPSSGLPLL